MLTVPTPPTDNLYKFMAFTGAILIVVSQVGPALALRQTIDRISTFADETSKRVSEFADRQVSLNKEFAEARAKVKEWNDQARADDKFRSESLEYARRMADAPMEILKVKAEILSKSVSPELRSHLAALQRCGYAGWALAATGFCLWWWKIQRLQDRILVSESKKIKKESEAP